MYIIEYKPITFILNSTCCTVLFFARERKINNKKNIVTYRNWLKTHKAEFYHKNEPKIKKIYVLFIPIDYKHEEKFLLCTNSKFFRYMKFFQCRPRNTTPTLNLWSTCYIYRIYTYIVIILLSWNIEGEKFW